MVSSEATGVQGEQMIATALTFLGSGLGRIVIIAAGALTFLGAYGWHKENVGIRKVVQASKAEGKRNNAKSAKIRQDTRKPGAFNRLLESDCRDCK